MACIKGKRTPEEVEAEANSKRIERQLRAERANREDPIKLLLLGTGASGKSTFLKQLKVIHKDGFSKSEIDHFRDFLPSYTLNGMQRIVSALIASGKKLNSHKKDDAEKIIAATSLDEGVGDLIKEFWAMDEVKEMFERRNELGLLVDSSVQYYFDQVERFAKSNYTPTLEDIVRARVKTTGIREVLFDIKGREFIVIDVGGQRSERRKWIHQFENVNAIIFFAALDEYDMRLEEDSRTNCLEESLQLFSELTGSQFFADKKNLTWILFLNKTDLLKEKIKWRPLSQYYRDYPTSSDLDYGASLKFIRNKYEAKFRGRHDNLYVYNTCAIDNDNCKKVFEAIRDKITMSAVDEAFGGL